MAALGGPGVVLLVHAGLGMSGGLGVDQRLQDRVEQGAHQLAVIGGAHRFSQFEQGKLVQGHRVTPTFVSDFGRLSQRLTGWPLTLVTVSATTIRNPIYTSRLESIRDYLRAGKDRRRPEAPREQPNTQ